MVKEKKQNNNGKLVDSEAKHPQIEAQMSLSVNCQQLENVDSVHDYTVTSNAQLFSQHVARSSINTPVVFRHDPVHGFFPSGSIAKITDELSRPEVIGESNKNSGKGDNGCECIIL
ncbi:MAG: hypothetical protein HRU36_00565 [Rickettsiales bacterium]|nr:hypothetical protein [Rickettsiales bacterium]